MIKTEAKTIRIDLTIKINESLEHDIKLIVGHNEYFTEYTIKIMINNYCLNMNMNMKESLNYI